MKKNKFNILRGLHVRQQSLKQELTKDVFLVKVEFKTQPSNGLGADSMSQTIGEGHWLHIKHGLILRTESDVWLTVHRNSVWIRKTN